MRTSLRRKLILVNLCLLSALIMLGLALAFGVESLRNAVTGATDEYAELRLVEEAMLHASRAEEELDLAEPNYGGAIAEVNAALERLGEFGSFQGSEEIADDEHQQSEHRHHREAEDALVAMRERIESHVGAAGAATDTPGTARGAAPAPLPDSLAGAAIDHLSRLASTTDVAVARSAAAERTVTTLIVVCSLCGLLVLGSIGAIGICYRSVLQPLRRFHEGVQRIASGHFTQRLDQRGSREFAELAADFNRMASELESLYRDLDNRVKDASRDLARSERLASVGFLAAGVAHEINNPLGIVSGYAELAQRWMNDRATDRRDDVRSALGIIGEEAFRCKEITEKLLSLSRVGESRREMVSLPALVDEVARMLRGLKTFDDRRLTVRLDRSASAPVHGNASELKQVLLNLIVNAMEAVEPGTGEVLVSGSRDDGRVRIAVRDNGCGMSAEVLERAFEPFYSARANRGSRATRGVGLGLSISHAIVEGHGGTIRAESAGTGKGSAFTIELPIGREGDADAA